MDRKTAVAAAVGSVGTAALGVALLAGLGSANAADPSPSSPPSSNAQPSQSGKPGDRGLGSRHGPRGLGPGSAKALATKLGKTEAQVRAALDKARRANRPAQGTKPDPATIRDRIATTLAAELKLDKAKVLAALQAVQAERRATHEAAFKARLAAAVKAGKLTQAEANAVLKAARAGVIAISGRGPR